MKIPSPYTHVIAYDGGVFTMSIGSRSEIDEFARTLHRFNGVKPWALTLFALPDGMDYGEMLAAGQETTEFLQAGGGSEAMTMHIRKPGGDEWGVKWVRYIVGHPHEGTPPLDVPIKLPRSTQMVSGPEVFEAEEAADLFFVYYQTGDIPAHYALRPVEGWTSDGTNVDLCESTQRR